MPRFRFVFAVTALGLAFACTRSPEPPPSAPQPGPEPAAEMAAPPPPAEAPAPAAAPATPSSLDEAEPERRKDALSAREEADDANHAVAELERARAEFDAALPGQQKPRPSSNASGAGASRGAADAAPPAKAEKKSSESSCATACRAFASLDRAASAVCRIAGEKDARCGHAHEVVSDAKKRVAVCSCRDE